jgi:hypothetical protein
MSNRNQAARCLRVLSRIAPPLACLGTMFLFVPAHAQSDPPREAPARKLPTPTTVSPQMQRQIAAPLNPAWNFSAKTAEEWKAQAERTAAAGAKGLPALRDEMRVKSEPIAIGGVKAFMLTPETIAPENRNRLLIHVHGGGAALADLR